MLVLEMLYRKDNQLSYKLEFVLMITWRENRLTLNCIPDLFIKLLSIITWWYSILANDKACKFNTKFSWTVRCIGSLTHVTVPSKILKIGSVGIKLCLSSYNMMCRREFNGIRFINVHKIERIHYFQQL